MDVADRQSQGAMWSKTRLEPHFIRSIRREKRPVGRIYQDPSTKVPRHLAEIEEVYVLQIADAKTGQERSVVIDPRHPQSREHLKLAQEVLEGRIGGLTPVRLQFEDADSLDPEGHPIKGTEIVRVAEMESPVPTRSESKMVVGGKQIGEWSHDVDAAVDRTASFEVAHRFAAYMEAMSTDPESKEWAEIEALARGKFSASLRDTISDDQKLQREVGRFMPSREDLLAGRHADRSGTGVAVSAWDPMRSPLPATHAEQGAFFAQQALIERFQMAMQHIPKLDAEGNLSETNLFAHVEETLIHDKHLPSGRPSRDVETGKMVINEKSRSIATHMLAGYLKCQGAEIRDADLATELNDDWRMHADVLKVMKAANVPNGAEAKHYFSVAGLRAANYRHESGQKVESHAKKTMKFPEPEKEVKPKSELNEHIAGALKHLGSVAHGAGNDLENTGFGL